MIAILLSVVGISPSSALTMETQQQDDDSTSSYGIWLAEVVDRLKRNDRTLTELEIGSSEEPTEVGDEGFETESMWTEADLLLLSNALRRNRNLQRFKLSKLSISKSTVMMFASALKHHTSLEHLAIEDCIDAEEGSMCHLLTLALSRNQTIQSLSLCGNWFASSSPCWHSFGLSLYAAQNVVEVRLCHNEMDIASAQVLANAIEYHESIKILDLTGNSLDDVAVGTIAKVLYTNKVLEFLTLDFNGFGDKGVRDLANALLVNSTLIELHLFGNRVTGVGAESLASALYQNGSLQSLILSFNQIGDRGAAALAQALTINTTLTKIWFPSNAVGNLGMHAFADLLPRMKGLEQLNVGLLLDEEAAEALVKALEYNLSLSVLHMEQPIIPVEYGEEESSEDPPPLAAMDFFLRLNRSGRRLLREAKVRPGVWAHVLARATPNRAGTPDVLYYLLKEKPELLDRQKRAW